MRVAFLNQFYVPDLSPTAHLCASLAEHRAELGDDVTVITSRSGYVAPAVTAQSDRGVRVLRIWSTWFGSRSRFGRLIDWGTFYVHAVLRTMMLPKQDVIVSLTTPPFIALAGVLHKLLHPTTRLVLWNMDCYPEALERTGMIRPEGFIARAMRAINRALFRRMDHLVVLDGAMKKLLLSQYEPSKRRVPCAIIPNWERASLFDDRSPSPSPGTPGEGWGEGFLGQSSHSQLDPVAPNPHPDPLPEYRERGKESAAAPLTVLYLGNAGYGHEFETMLCAAQLLKTEPVTFRFIGGGAKRQWIESERRRLELENIAFEDYVPKEHTPDIMRAADCALVTLEDPMLGVMSPSKLHSNLAMALPILYVGPEGGNVDEAIQRFGCGISLRPGQPQQMADFIRSLMRDPQRHAELRRRARQAFEDAYCDLTTLPQFDAIFASLSRTN